MYGCHSTFHSHHLASMLDDCVCHDIGMLSEAAVTHRAGVPRHLVVSLRPLIVVRTDQVQ